MWKLALLLLGLVAGVHSDCSCYQPSTYTGKSAILSNSYDPVNFSACYSSACSFVAYSGNDTYGWTQLTLQWDPVSDTTGKIQIFDGATGSGTPLIQVAAGENIDSSSAKYLIKSSSPRIYITYSQTGTSANKYYGSIKAVPGLQPSAAPITTTASPTTRTYNPTDFVKDPHLITHDILIAINQKTTGGITALNGMNGIAYNFVQQLSITTDYSSISSTRLSLATLTPYSPYYAVQGEIWGLTADSFFSSLPQSGVTIEGSIDNALIGLAQLAFQVNTSSSTDSRPNVQRTLVLVTAEWPSTGANLNETVVKPKFDELGANLLVVGWNLSDLERSLVMRPNRWYNVVNANVTKNSAIAKFVNPFYFNDGSDLNFWCPAFTPVLDSSNTFTYFQEPFNYIGADGVTDGKNDWSKLVPFDGKKGRYCDFANSQYTYTMPSGVTSVKVSVFYELEAGKDTLNFYDASSNLIASFTGYDISEGSFYTSTPTLTAVFTSDNKSVYRGFYVKIVPQKSS